MRHNRLNMIVVVLLLFCGCHSIGKRPAFITILDQGYRTGGASEARLGSHGFVVGRGFFSPQPNVFEREGFDRSLLNGVDEYERAILDAELTKKVLITTGGEVHAAYAKVTGELTEESKQDHRLSLVIIDLDKQMLVENLNENKELLEKFRQSKNYRIVTAVAVLLSLSEEDYKRLLSGRIVAQGIPEIEGEIQIKNQAQSVVRVHPKNIYAYQISQVVWSDEKKRDSVRYLRTDRYFWWESNIFKN